MNNSAEDNFWYPTVDDILTLHADIIAEDSSSDSGVHDPDRVEFVLTYIRDGYFGEVPSTVHEKAFHLMRLLASNHWFADGNKRTALNTTELFYLLNGYQLDYGDDIRSMLKLFSVRETLIDDTAGPAYLADQTTEVAPDGDSDPLAGLAVLILALVAEYSDEDLEDIIPADDAATSVRDQFGLTREYGTTVNLTEGESESTDGS